MMSTSDIEPDQLYATKSIFIRFPDCETDSRTEKKKQS